MNKKIVVSTMLAAMTSAPVMGQSLSERVDELEMKSLMESISWGGTFISRYDAISAESISAAGTKSELSYNPLRMYFLLDMKADISDKLTFYGRQGFSKFWNDSTVQDSYNAGTTGSARGERGDQLYVERAYIRYKLHDKLSFSVGRLPTIEGPAFHSYDNLQRQGTYPEAAFPAMLDGMALSFNHQFNKHHGIAFRAVYTPLSTLAKDSNGGPGRAKINNTGTAASGGFYNERAELITLMAEYTAKNLSWVREINFILQYSALANLDFSDSLPRGFALSNILGSATTGRDARVTPIAAAGSATSPDRYSTANISALKTWLQANAPTALNAPLQAGSSVTFGNLLDARIAAPGETASTSTAGTTAALSRQYVSLIEESYAQGSNLTADYQSFSVYLNFEDIAKTRLSVNLTGMFTSTDSEGRAEQNTGLATFAKSLGLSPVDLGQGFNTASASGSEDGSAFILGVNYKLPYRNAIIGGQYLDSDREFLYFETDNSELMTDFFATRGTAWHLWHSMTLTSGLRFRVGYVSQNHDYAKGFLGRASEGEFDESTFYSQLRADF